MRLPTALALSAVLVTGLAACSGSSGGAAPSPAATTQSAADAAGVAAYTPIKEPFPSPGDCDENGSTVEMTNCVLEQVLDADSTVNQLQQRRFESAGNAGEQAKLGADDTAWLQQRGSTCAAAPTSGGTLDQITGAQCLLKASQARVKQLQTA